MTRAALCQLLLEDIHQMPSYLISTPRETRVHPCKCSRVTHLPRVVFPTTIAPAAGCQWSHGYESLKSTFQEIDEIKFSSTQLSCPRQGLLLNVFMNVCKHPGVTTVSLTLCCSFWPLFHFDQQNLVSKPGFLWGMSQNQCQVFSVNLVFPFNNRIRPPAKTYPQLPRTF